MAEKMSVTRALVELKTLDKRILKAVQELRCSVPRVGKNLPTGFPTEEDFVKSAKAGLQQVQDLIARRRAIRSALVRTNATTTVKVGSETMTVAEAIERKHSIQHDEGLRDQLSGEYARATSAVEERNVNIRKTLDQILMATFGRQGSQVTGAEFDAVAKPYLLLNETTLLDPLNIKSRIEELSVRIDEFTTNVDVALNEVNAVTTIEV